MRLSTDADRDEGRSLDTIKAALDAGITIFDTAPAYGRDVSELGHNERLLANAITARGAENSARIVTKGGMTRTGGAWVPDGRAKTILSDCEASLAALGGLPIDLYLLHAPDPRTPWRTSLRALARLVEEGVVQRVGVSNVNRHQLDEALDLAPISAVQVALNVFDDRALRGGIVERCEQRGLVLMAHSPLGGPRRVRTLGRQDTLREIADAHDATPAEVALAWLLQLSSVILPIPGARRPDTARSAAYAARLRLDDDQRAAIDRAFGATRSSRTETPRSDASEVVLIMGIPGAGKSRLAHDFVAREYLRLNRDEQGGSLRDLVSELDAKLESDKQSIVLDNTFLTRASRSYVIETARRHGLRARCIWLDTPLAQAQVNLVARLLDRLGSLPTPEKLRELAKREEGILSPTSQMRTVRELEPPTEDEGWDEVEHVSFLRVAQPYAAREGVFVAAAALRHPGGMDAIADTNPGAPHLVFDWIPEGSDESLASAVASLTEVVTGPVSSGVCPHGGGPPRCWCRPPLPGLPMAFARAHQIDLSRSTVVGCRPAHRTLADALGARYLDLSDSTGR